jgi:hypothetical protein
VEDLVDHQVVLEEMGVLVEEELLLLEVQEQLIKVMLVEQV